MLSGLGETPGGLGEQLSRNEEDICIHEVSPNFDDINVNATGEEENATNSVVREDHAAATVVGCEIRPDGLACLTHGCLVKKIKVTSKKWDWVERKKSYGWKSKKVDRFICNGRREADNMNPDNCSVPGTTNSGLGERGEVGRGGDTQEVERQLFTSVFKNVGRGGGG